MDPSTPILYSDEEGQSTPILYNEDPTSLDECVDPYDQTEDYEENQEGCSFVQIALDVIDKGDIDEVKKMTERSDLDLVWKHGKVLSSPIEKNNVALVRLLVNTCPDREKYLLSENYYEFARENIPMREAISFGNFEVFEALFELGIMVDFPKPDDVSLQQLAIWGGNIKIMKHLLHMGHYPKIRELFKTSVDREDVIRFVLKHRRRDDILNKAELLRHFGERGMFKCCIVLASWEMNFNTPSR